MNKKFVIGFFILGIVLLVSAVLFFAVPQDVIGKQLTLDNCRSYVKNSWCAGGSYSCSDCSLVTLPYYVIISGTTTNKVYSADCVNSADTGIGATGLPRTYCQLASNIVSHSYYQCVGNDVYWYNSANQKETVKTSCSYRCNDNTLTTASCVSAPSCQSQGQSCGTPSLPSCCSGLTCQNFGCYPPTTPTPTTKSTYCSDTSTLCQNGAFDSACTGGTKVNCPAGCDLTNKVCKTPTCSNKCASVGLKECVLPSTFRQCISSNGCLQWDTTANCPSGTTCTDGVCHAFSSTTPSIPMPKCLDASFICMANPQTFNGVLTSCDGYKCQYGCSNDVCNSAPAPAPTCTVSTVCSGSSKVLITNADCTTKTTTCDSGEYCNSGVCTLIPITPPTDLCMGVTCQDSCTDDYTYQSAGSCVAGKCVYASVQTTSPKCLSPISNVTSNLTNSITGDIVDNGANNVKPTFLNTYGLWIAGGVFILSLLLFVVQFGGKKKRGRK